MAKSNVKAIKSKKLNTKTVHHRQSKQSAKVVSCVSVTLSCGPRGWACGDTLQEIIDKILVAEAATCES